MEKLLSVIVPVYNAEKYIDKCVSRLLAQTYKNIEIILVNDGSKDNSLKKCLAWTDKDCRVKVFDKPNGGAASARNYGIREAKGEFIGFCDADDFFDEDAFETLIAVMESNGLPTIECVARIVNCAGVIEEDDRSRELCIKPVEQAVKDIFLRRGGVSLATRVTRAEFIKDIQIPEGKRVEDFYFTILLLLKTKSTAVYQYPFYNCFISDGSVTRSGGGSIYFDALYFYYKAIEVLADKDYKLQEEQEYYLFKMYYLLAVSLTKKERKQFKNEISLIKKEIKLNKKKIKTNQYLLGKEKFVLKIASLSFFLPKIMYIVKNRGNK